MLSLRPKSLLKTFDPGFEGTIAVASGGYRFPLCALGRDSLASTQFRAWLAVTGVGQGST